MTRLRKVSQCLFSLALAWSAGTSPLEGQNPSDEPPVAGRPLDFSHVVGRYRISAAADRTDVLVEDPITLTIRISGQGPKQYQPVRKLLHIFADDFAEQFYLEPMPRQDRVLPSEGGWEFVYRLRPKTAQIRFISGPKLVYFYPERRAYQTSYADDIPLTVKPRPEKKPEDFGLKAVQAPEQFYRLVTGDSVLAKQQVRPYWSPAMLMVLLLGPPLLSAMAFLLWRRLHPDGDRLLLQRRSRAARRAMHDLLRNNDHSPAHCVAVLTGYLNERLDFAAQEPTPAEVARFLKRRGVAMLVRKQWAEFLDACDAARFGPVLANGQASWPKQAVNLVNALEAELGTMVSRSHAPHARSMIAILIALIFAPPTHAGTGSDDGEILRLAESSFQQGSHEKKDLAQARRLFAESAKNFAKLHDHGVANADLYLNWGNAELLAERVPQAILAYRRGLRLAPGRPDLVENLNFALESVSYPPTASAQRVHDDHPLSTLIPSLWWLVGYFRLLLCLGTFALYTLACLAAVSWFRHRPGLLPWRTALLLILAGACGYFWYREEMELERDRTQPLVVIAQETNCRLGNGHSYPSNATLPTPTPGMEARRLSQRGDWVQIQMAGGVIGWVPREAVLVDER